MDIQDSETRRWKIWEIHFEDIDVLKKQFPFIESEKECLVKYLILDHLWKAGKLDTRIQDFEAFLVDDYHRVFLQYKELNLHAKLFDIFMVAMTSNQNYHKELKDYLHTLSTNQIFDYMSKFEGQKLIIFYVLAHRIYDQKYVEYDTIMNRLTQNNRNKILAFLVTREMKMKSDRISFIMNEILKINSVPQTAILIYNFSRSIKGVKRRIYPNQNYLLSILDSIHQIDHVEYILNFFTDTKANILKEILDCDLHIITNKKKSNFFRILSMVASKFLSQEQLISLGTELKNPTILDWYSEYTSQV